MELRGFWLMWLYALVWLAVVQLSPSVDVQLDDAYKIPTSIDTPAHFLDTRVAQRPLTLSDKAEKMYGAIQMRWKIVG